MTSADVMNVVLTIAAVPLTTILTGLMMKLYQHFGMTVTAQDKANMEAEIQAALGAGIAAAQVAMPLAMSKGIMSPEVRHVVLTQATNYFRTRFPDRTAQIASAVSGTGQEPHAAVAQTLDARLSIIKPETTRAAALRQLADALAAVSATTLPAPVAKPAPPP